MSRRRKECLPIIHINFTLHINRYVTCKCIRLTSNNVQLLVPVDTEMKLLSACLLV